MAGLRAQEGEPFGGNLICDSAGGDMMEVAKSRQAICDVASAEPTP